MWARPVPAATGAMAAVRVRGRQAITQARVGEDALGGAPYGNHGYLRKSGLRFSRNAFLPSCPCSVM